MEQDPLNYSHRKTSYPEIGTAEVRRQIGKEIKSAREFQEMSLEQVTSITKINVRFLENIEEGRWNFLPPTYVKAFIRAYSSAVGLPKDKLSNRLDDLFQHVVTAQAQVRVEPSAMEEMDAKRSMGGFMAWAERRRALLFYGFIGAIAAVLLAIYLIRSLNEPSVVVERADTTNSTAAPSALIKSDSTISALKPNTAATTDTTSMVELKIMAVDTCYLKLESRDSLVYDKTIWPGNVVEFSLPQPIRLTMGNAPGIELVVDGVKLPAFPSSRRNQVVRLGSGGIIN